MSYTSTELGLLIGTIGLATVVIRAIFLFYLPKSADHPLIKRGMEAVPAAMLVALVVPFTLFVDQRIELLRTEVYAILLALPLMRLTKKYAYGLVFAVLIYLALTWV
ncbi:MAG: AzlD domain-containing protein [Candidatus Kariarchaeaceae archaeon]|jgi:branched-subunit amino acid transport protein